MKNIERKKYLDGLVSLRNDGMMKVITGMHRYDKSYLLFKIFTSYLEKSSTAPKQLIKVDLEDYKKKEMRNPDNKQVPNHWLPFLIRRFLNVSNDFQS